MTITLPNNRIQLEFKNNLLIVIFNDYTYGDIEVIHSLIEENLEHCSSIKTSIVDISNLIFQNKVIHDDDLEYANKIFKNLSNQGRELVVLVTGNVPHQYELIVSAAKENGLNKLLYASTMDDALKLINLVE